MINDKSSRFHLNTEYRLRLLAGTLVLVSLALSRLVRPW